MHDILLTALILFSGFVPVGIALWYSKQLLKKADDIYIMGKAERDNTVKEMKKWLLDEQFSTHLTHVFNGYMGSEVKKVKKNIEGQAILEGIPAPGKRAISKGIASWAMDWGMSKNTAKGIEAAVDMVLNRKSKAEKARDVALVQQYARDLGYDPNISVQPSVIPVYNDGIK